MKYCLKNNIHYSSIISNFFFFLFTSTVFSPNINMNAIYLYVLVPFLDVNYLRNMLVANRKKLLIVLLFIVSSLILFDFKMLFKVAVIFITVSYLYYTYQNDRFYLYRYIVLNIIIAIIQFLGISMLDIQLLDPEEISRAIFGNFAMKTGETIGFGNLLLQYRVSGFNKEPGFFSALLIMSFVFLWFDKKIKNKNFLFFFILIGILLSFSKISISFAIFFMLLPLKKHLNRISIFITVPVYLLMVCFSVKYLYLVTGLLEGNFYYANSIIHRTIGYFLLMDLNILDYFFGIRDLTLFADTHNIIKLSPYITQPSLILDNSGIAKIVIENGIPYFLMLLSVLYMLRVKSFYFITFLIIIMNVNPFTSSSFVILGIFYMLLNTENGVVSSYG